MQNRFRLKSFPELMCPFLESAAAKVSLDFRIDWVYRKKTMKAYLNVSCWGNELWSKKKSLGLEVIILSAKRSLIFLKDFFLPSWW